MKYQLLMVRKPFPIVRNDRASNPINGFDSEILAAGHLLNACGAEVRWGSRNEEGNKIDIVLSYNHPWYKEERLLVMVQVKSGNTYGSLTKDGFNLKSSAKKLSQRTTKGVCVIWVDRTTSKSFWAFIHPKTQKGIQEYGAHHHVTPALRFDLARCDVHGFSSYYGGIGITLSTKGSTLKEMRACAKHAYHKLQIETFISPTLGEIKVSRVGWRHMFRSSRAPAKKQSSFAVIHHLSKFLQHKPSETVVFSTSYYTQEEYTVRRIEHLLTFTESKYFDKKMSVLRKIKVIIRLVEEIRYPTNWQSVGIISQKIDRCVTLISCYYKVV